jgi:hypothetical protein
MDATILAIVRMALHTITDRLLTVLSLLMTFGLAAWAMYAPTEPRLYIAGGFAVLVYIPSVLKERKRHEKAEQHREP